MKNNREFNILTALIGISFLFSMAGGMMQLLIPAYAVSLQTDTEKLGVIMGLAGAGRFMCILPSGLMVDQYGAGRIFMCSLFVSLTSAFLFSGIHSVGLLAVFALISFTAQSIAFMGIKVDYITSIPNLDIGSNQLGRQKTAILGGYYLAGNIAGGFFINFNSYSLGFIVPGAMMLACFVLRGTFLKKSNAPIDLHKERLAVRKSIEQILELVRTKSLHEPILLETAMAVVQMIFSTFIFSLAIEQYGFTLESVSAAVVVQGFFSIVATISGERLIKVTSLKTATLFGMAATVAGCAAAAAGKSFVLLILGSALIGLGTGMINLTNYVKLSLFQGEKGKALSLISLGNALGSTVGPLAGGFAAKALGTGSAFLVPIPVFIFLVIWLLARKHRVLKTS